jgi:hypothetical protein
MKISSPIDIPARSRNSSLLDDLVCPDGQRLFVLGKRNELYDKVNADFSQVADECNGEDLRRTFDGGNPPLVDEENDVFNNYLPMCSNAKVKQRCQEKQPRERGRRLSVDSDISIASSHNEDFASVLGVIKPSRPVR